MQYVKDADKYFTRLRYRIAKAFRPRLRWRLILILILTLVAIRAIAPVVIEYSFNKAIDRAPNLKGRIDDIDLHLYRGAYELEGVDIDIVNNEQQLPFLKIERVDISILWGKLIRGQIVAEIFLENWRFDIQDVKENNANEESYLAASREENWLPLKQRAVPFGLQLDRVESRNGRLTFKGRSLDTASQGELFITALNGVALNLTRQGTPDNPAPASLELQGKVYGESDLVLKGTVDALGSEPVFDVDAKIQALPAKLVDPLIKVYAPFDLEAGSFIFASELQAKNGKVEGYIKFGAHDLEIFSWKQDALKDKDNPFQLITDALIGGISAVLTNRKTAYVATRIPVKGQLDKPDVSLSKALYGLLRNAFIEALDLKIENLLSFEPEGDIQK